MSRLPLPPRLRGRIQISLLRARHHRRYAAAVVGAVGTVVLLVLDPPSGLTWPLLGLTILVTVQGRRYAFDPALDRRLAGAPIDLEVLPGRFSPPQDVAVHAPAILAAKFQGGIALYDSTVLRLASDPCADEWPVRVQRARYFAGEVTNESVSLDVRERRDGAGSRELLNGSRLLQSNRIIYDIATSPCANIIGVSTLAITDDSQLVVIHQSRASAQSAGQLAPSGSGSAEPVDLRPGATLQDVVARAMERELREECNVPAGRGTVRTLVLGYARDLNRGGKPEFFGLSRLGVRFDALQRSRRERAYVAAIDPAAVRMRTPGALKDALRSFRDARGGELSLALHLNLAAVERAIDDDWQHVAGFLGRRRPDDRFRE